MARDVPDYMQDHFDNVIVGFDPDYLWIDGQFDIPEALVAAIKDQDGLGDFTDGNGNRQAAIRLDYDPENADGFWAIVPKGTKQAALNSAAKAYDDKVKEIQDAANVAATDNPAVNSVLEALEALPANKPLTKADIIAALTNA